MMRSMDNSEEIDDEACLCQGFVPENKRVDFYAIRPDKKTGKPKATVVLRYHQDCPDHGLNVRYGPTKPYDPENPNRLQRISR